MRCVNCDRTLRSSYIGGGIRAYVGDYCFKCKPLFKKQINKKVV